MKTIRNALKILAVFKDHEGPLGVNDIAHSEGFEKSYVSRVLSAMRDMNFLVQDPTTKKYTVGLEAFALGMRYTADEPLTRTALPVMREMSLRTGDSIFLTMRHDNHCRHIVAVEGEQFLETRSRLGVRLPLHASASGKALLAFSSLEVQSTLLDEIDFAKFTDGTITTRSGLEQEIASTLERGFSVSRQELVKGLAAWAVPVYGEHGELLAALSIIMPESMVANKNIDTQVQVLHDGARRLSSLCGARVYPH